MSLVTKLTGKLEFTYISAVGGTNVLYQPEIDLSDEMLSGVIVDTADKLYVAKSVALSGSATNTIDFAGSLADAFGTTITAVKIKMFYFHNLSTTAGNTITLGGNANEMLFWSAAGTQTVGPNGRVLIWEPSLAGIPVTAATGDILDILNNTANAITYDVAFIGTSS